MVKKISAPASVSDAVIKGDTAPAPAAGPAAPIADIDAVLSGLDSAAAATAGAAQQAEAKQEKHEVDTVKADILDLLDLVAAPAEKMMWWLQPKQFEELWGKESRKKIAEPLAAIARRNGWDMGGVLNDYGPYAALAMALGPPAYVTFKVHKEAKAYYAAEAEKKGQDGAATT